jgi:hypothetical protein
MFLIGSPGREVSNLRQEAATAPQQSYLARTLPSQEIAYHPGPDLAILFVLLMFKSSIQVAPQLTVVTNTTEPRAI